MDWIFKRDYSQSLNGDWKIKENTKKSVFKAGGDNGYSLYFKNKIIDSKETTFKRLKLLAEGFQFDENILHVYPENDIIIHQTDHIECDCDPSYQEENGVLIVVHNSLDGREAVEMAKEILK